MADTKISDLTTADALDGSELLLLSQDGVDVKLAIDDLVTYAGAGGEAFWVRPSDWPARPTSAAQQIVLLARVDNGSINYAAVTISCSSGGYDVDWGDGTTTTNASSGSTTSKNLSYAGVSSAATTEGFKVAVVVITPNTGGAQITVVDLGARHSTVGGSGTYYNPWLEIEANCPNVQTFNFSIGGTVALRDLRSIIFTSLHTNAYPGLGGLGAPGLRNVEMFAGMCSTSTSVMTFVGCTSLQTITFPENYGAATTSLANLLSGCNSLVEINWPSSFGSASVTTIASAFNACRSLKSLTLPSGFGANSGCVTASNVFNECFSLAELTLPTDFGRYATNISSMFANCTVLRSLTLPANFGAAATNVQNAFSSMCALRELNIPSAFGTVTTAGNFANGCFGLRSLTGNFPAISFSIANCSLDAAALDAVYTALATVTSQTITVSNNYGTSGDDPTIATAKGWTVTGS